MNGLGIKNSGRAYRVALGGTQPSCLESRKTCVSTANESRARQKRSTHEAAGTRREGGGEKEREECRRVAKVSETAFTFEARRRKGKGIIRSCIIVARTHFWDRRL